MKPRGNRWRWMLPLWLMATVMLSACDDVSEPAEKAGEEIDKVLGHMNEGIKELVD